MKINLFKATVESILLYGAECWTLSQNLERGLDGCYTRMLRTVLNISWKDHPTLQEIYGDTPRISQILQKRRLKFAGHCYRSAHEPVSKLVLWAPTQGKRGRGRPAINYINQISRDTGLNLDELGKTMEDRDQWRTIAKNVFDRGRP